MDEPKLKILLLGPPAVYQGDKPVTISRKIVRALLFFLAGEHRFISRNRIINTFWPEENETDARRHLREILSKLRSALPLKDALLSNQDQVSLDFRNIYVDAFEFSEFIYKNRPVFEPTRTKSLDPDAFKEMDRLIFLWRSPRFMAGFNSPNRLDFEAWLRKTGSLLESHRSQIMKILAKDTATRGDLISSEWWLRRALEEDEFDSELQFRYLETLSKLGRSREALDFYLTLQKLYEEEELGEIPLIIREMEMNIRTTSRTSPPSDTFHWPGTVDTTIPFIGRKRILDEIKQTYSRGGSVILKGEAGLGKSRLAFELFQQISPHPILFFAQGRSHESDLPFQTIIDCLRHSITLQEWKHLDPLHRNTLARLMPELNPVEASKDLALPPPVEPGRSAIFEAFHQLLLGLVRDDQVIFFVDDAHWCDRSSMEFLAYLQQRGFFHENRLLLLAFQVEEKDDFSEEFVCDPKHPNSLQSLILERFDYSEAFQLADTILGFAPSGALVQRLMLDAGGNPLMLIETLHALQKLGLNPDQINSVENLPLAGSIRVLIRNRLKQLTDKTREVLITAAVIGNTFSISILYKANSLEQSDFVSAIEELEKRHLIQSLGEGSSTGSYSFIHDKIRESLLMDISPVRINLIHERVAKAMEETGSNPRQAAVIAEHFQKAGDVREAFHYWIEAGVYARYMYSPHEASLAFQNAEKLFLQTEILLDFKEIHKLYINWADLMEERNDLAGWTGCFNKLIEWGRKRQSPLLVGSGFNGLAHIEIQKINPQKAKEYIQEAEVFLNQVDDKMELGKFYNHKGIIYQLTSELDLAAESYRISLSLTEGMLDPLVMYSRCNLLTRTAILEVFLCNTQNALRITEENIRLGEQTGNHMAACWGYATKSLTQNLVADYENGIETAQSGLRIANSIQNQHLQAYLYIALGKNELDLGRLKKGWVHIHQSISLSREYQHFEVLSQAYEGLSEIYFCLQNYDKAGEIASTGMECHKNNFQMYWNMLMYGFTRLLTGDLDGGEEKVGYVLETSQKTGLNYVYYMALVCEAYLNISRGNLEIARISLNKVIELCRPCDMHVQVYLGHWLLGSISLLEGNSEKALGWVEKAICIAKKIQNPWLEINILQLKAQIRMKQKRDITHEKDRIDELCREISAGGVPVELEKDFEHFRRQISLD